MYQYPGGITGIRASGCKAWVIRCHGRSESVDPGADRILAFNMSVPFSVLIDAGARHTWIVFMPLLNANRNRDGDNSWQTGVGGTLLKRRNLSYSVTQGRSIPMVIAAAPALAGRRDGYGTLGVGYNCRSS